MSVPVCLAAGGSVHRNLKNILEWWKNVKGVDMFGNQQIFVTQFSLNPVWEWNCILRQAEGFSFVMLSVAIFQKMLCHWGWKWRSWNSWSFFFLFALKVVPVRALWSSFVVRSSIVSGDNLLFLLLTIRSDINDFRNICKTPCVVWELLVSLRVLHHRFLSGVPGACIWWVGWIGHHNYHHDYN